MIRIIIFFLLLQSPALAQKIVQLRDELHHPDLAWPVSLLSYKAKGVRAVVDIQTGRFMPFQQSGETLYLLSDLPSGAQRQFRFQTVPGENPSPVHAVRVKNHQGSIELSNGLITVQIPTSGEARPPILQFGNLGRGQLPVALKAARMQVQPLETGSLTSAFSIKYALDHKRYTVVVRLTAAMEFVELEETMQGFSASDSLSWTMIWDGFHPNTRYASTRQGEPMDGLPDSLLKDKHPFQPTDQRNGKNGLLPFRLALYDNWMTWWRLPTAAFWNKDQSIGLFIKEAEKWNDTKYAIWGSGSANNILYHWKNNVLDYTFPLVNGTRSIALAAYPHSKDQQRLAHIDYLRRYYGWIPLNKTKDWILDYEGNDGNFPKHFTTPEKKLSLSWLQQSLHNAVGGVAKGAERNHGPTPVGARVFYESVAPAFDINRNAMDPAQYRQLRARFLFMNYVFMDEALMPMRTMLSGHPNFLMDIKSMAGLSAFLFPGHPQAKQMADHFEKAIQLNHHFHIRPPVKAWNTQGGRWTENLATYTWAALRPTLRTNFLLHHYYDQKNRILQPGVSELGNWLLNAITSPLQSSGRRGFPPQGAHAQDFKEGPPELLRLLGQELTYYDPLLAEHLFYITDSGDQPFEGDRELTQVWKGLLKDNQGTQPDLRSTKFTGYGIVLRSNFAKPNETYIHLQQIDEGPNYRWGRAGGNGVIYYYANGKRYSFNGPEDVGDLPFGEVERCTNFGVKQDTAFRSIGRGDLTAPLYDFGFVQQATVLGKNGACKSRSLIQSGSDYIVVFDDVAQDTLQGRFSWFTGTQDEFPFIHQVQPGASFVDVNTAVTKGRYYDGKGDFLTVVTHLPDVKVEKTNYGVLVNTDHVFRTDTLIHYNEKGLLFRGKSGIITKNAGALFEGSEIGRGPLQIIVQQNAGISFETIDGGYKGKVQAATAVKMIFKGGAGQFFIDGLPVSKGNNLSIQFPPGEHNWQWSTTPVIAGAPRIIGTNNKKGGFTIHYTRVPGATGYEIKVNDKTVLTTNDTSATIENLPNNSKVFCRVKASNGGLSAAYPVYISNEAPHRPEGLQLTNGKLHWGQVLGAGSYHLYRKNKTNWELIYSGTARSFPVTKAVYEYAVTAVNGNGESDKSVPCTTDPDSFLNWYPPVYNGFRRITQNFENGFSEYNPFVEDTRPVLKYPD
jgi:hypothetical protein